MVWGYNRCRCQRGAGPTKLLRAIELLRNCHNKEAKVKLVCHSCARVFQDLKNACNHARPCTARPMRASVTPPIPPDPDPDYFKKASLSNQTLLLSWPDRPTECPIEGCMWACQSSDGIAMNSVSKHLAVEHGLQDLTKKWQCRFCGLIGDGITTSQTTASPAKE